MIIVIRNASGFDLFLATSTAGKNLYIHVYSDIPRGGRRVQKLEKGDLRGIKDCPEDTKPNFEITDSKISLRITGRKDTIDSLDDDNQVIGKETYLEFTLKTTN